MKIEVANLKDAADRIFARLPDNPGGIPVRIGWDGKRVAVFAGVYGAPTKSLPNERLDFTLGQQPPEIATALAVAAARIVPDLRIALAERRQGQRRPKAGHRWRRLAGYGSGD